MTYGGLIQLETAGEDVQEEEDGDGEASSISASEPFEVLRARLREPVKKPELAGLF